MSHIYRCSRCRTRNTFARTLASYVRPKKCRDCGHSSFYIDRERVARQPCHCAGYHHAHRPGSRCCDLNPKADWHRAQRAGLDGVDLAFTDAHGPAVAECPF